MKKRLSNLLFELYLKFIYRIVVISSGNYLTGEFFFTSMSKIIYRRIGEGSRERNQDERRWTTGNENEEETSSYRLNTNLHILLTFSWFASSVIGVTLPFKPLLISYLFCPTSTLERYPDRRTRVSLYKLTYAYMHASHPPHCSLLRSTSIIGIPFNRTLDYPNMDVQHRGKLAKDGLAIVRIMLTSTIT